MLRPGAGRRLTAIFMCVWTACFIPLWIKPDSFSGLAAGAFFLQVREPFVSCLGVDTDLRRTVWRPRSLGQYVASFRGLLYVLIRSAVVPIWLNEISPASFRVIFCESSRLSYRCRG